MIPLPATGDSRESRERRFRKDCKEQGKKVMVWTVNKPEEMIEVGVHYSIFPIGHYSHAESGCPMGRRRHSYGRDQDVVGHACGAAVFVLSFPVLYLTLSIPFIPSSGLRQNTLPIRALLPLDDAHLLPSLHLGHRYSDAQEARSYRRPP